ncbi:hypothetical protein IQ07DRAFT_660957 [Pyrenochaeta sp. DS3sAY3a]|nr:hypothetical protein IQ07DRAFT_660957 [Pyrenochaeta sp. DS3sAY3a]
MAEHIPAEEQANYETFRECLSEPILRALAAPVQKTTPRKKRHARRASKSGKAGEKSGAGDPGASSEKDAQDDAHQTSDAEALGDFIDYLTSLIFPSLPPTLRTLSHPLYTRTPSLRTLYSLPLSAPQTSHLLAALPPPALDSLTSYALLPSPADAPDIQSLFAPLLTTYITTVTAAPPPWSATRTSSCELCARSWVPLTYHHLIPKSVHDKVRKRGWHAEERLNSVAWLCRACHSFVHGLAGNEELARGFWSVELILQGGVGRDEECRERVERWVAWVGGVRWRSR